MEEISQKIGGNKPGSVEKIIINEVVRLRIRKY